VGRQPGKLTCYDWYVGHDDLTPITCLVCDGKYLDLQPSSSVRGVFTYQRCRWCTMGAMSGEQVVSWKLWAKKHRTSGTYSFIFDQEPPSSRTGNGDE